MTATEAQAKTNPPNRSVNNYPWSKFLLDLLTLIVLAATMVGVFWYACEAKKQSGLLDKSVTQQINNVQEQIADSRPIVLANGIQPLKKVKDEKTGKEKIIISDIPTADVHLIAVNFGKTVAVNVVVFGELAFGRAEHPAPSDPRCDPNGDPPLDTPKTPLAPAPESFYGSRIGFRNGETLTGRAEGENLFAIGCIYYDALDKKRYYTDVCTMWRDGSFQPCWSPYRNFIRERP